MSETFARDASRLAGKTCRWLAWRPGDFWSSTPAEISAIIEPDGGGTDTGLSRREFEMLMERDRNG